MRPCASFWAPDGSIRTSSSSATTPCTRALALEEGEAEIARIGRELRANGTIGG
jgi:hypothetical protein